MTTLNHVIRQATAEDVARWRVHGFELCRVRACRRERAWVATWDEQRKDGKVVERAGAWCPLHAEQRVRLWGLPWPPT